MKIRGFLAIAFFATVCFVFFGCEGAPGEDGSNYVNVTIKGVEVNAEAKAAIEQVVSAALAVNNGTSPPAALDISFTGSGFSLDDDAVMNVLLLTIEGYYVNLDLSDFSGAEFSFNSLASTVDKSRILSLTFSNNVTSIADGSSSLTGAFNGYTGLEMVKADAVVTVGSYAFSGTTMERVSLPAAKNINNYAFYYCSALESADFPVAESIGIYAFFYCTALESVNLPAAKIIGNRAFYYCSALGSVELPVAESIGDTAFSYCTALESVNLPMAETIGASVFWYSTTLESVDLSAVKSIGNQVFAYCVALKSVRLGVNAPAVGVGTFTSILAVQTVTVNVPSSSSGYGSSPTDTTTQNWGNAFRGMGWNGDRYLSDSGVNSYITLVINIVEE